MNKLIISFSILIIIGCNQSSKSDKTSDSKDVNRPDFEKVDSTIEMNRKSVSELDKQTMIDSNKCNINYALTVQENIDNLDTTMIADFLRTIDNCCKNNVEFGEVSNETLFKVLEKRPNLFLETFHRLSNELDTAYILFELRNPLHDLIPITEIITKFQDLKPENESKDAILRNLKKGDGNHK